jgi:hypothetical protein
MGNNVKVTVIATGFQRDSLPEFERRSPHFPFSSVSTPEIGMEKQQELAAVAAKESGAEGNEDDQGGKDEYEVPAILRKQRKASAS